MAEKRGKGPSAPGHSYVEDVQAPALTHQLRNRIELRGDAGKVLVQIERSHMIRMTQLQPAFALEFRALRPRIQQHAQDFALKRGRRMHDIREGFGSLCTTRPRTRSLEASSV